MSKPLKPTNRDISDVIDSMQKSFIEANGRLLTEEESVKLVDEIRKQLKKTGDIDYEN